MKKFIYYLAISLLFISCGDKPELEQQLKTITIEIERETDFLPYLEMNNVITAKSGTIEFNQSDWTEHLENGGNTLLTKLETNLTNKSVLIFKQKNVDFQLMCTYYRKDYSIEEEDIHFESKVTIRVDNKVVKTETFNYIDAFPTIIQYKK